MQAGDGGRNQALNEVYRVRGGYRVTPASYDFSTYNAPETRWAKDVTAVWMNWTWDQANMDPRSGAWRISESLETDRKRFGGFDAYIFWPFWLRAGYDDRSQFQHYADLPGGIPGLVMRPTSCTKTLCTCFFLTVIGASPTVILLPKRCNAHTRSLRISPAK